MPLLSPDLIYYCGQSIPWDPRSKALGGSEQAVVELSRHWAHAGLRVEVYGSIPEAMVCEGVRYRPLELAEQTLRADVVVLWRLYGLIGFWKGQQHFSCRLLAVDFHDRELFGHEPLLHQTIGQIQALMFKSKFHADFLLNKLPAEQQLPLRQRVKVIPNGIRKQDFSLASPPPREPHRFCYASCYLRGLAPLIEFFWPTVRQLWPDAELHVYYGMDHVHDQAVRDRINRLLQSEGVHDHGRQPVSVISEEKHRSSFHLYYTNSIIETDCISIKESAQAGCIPIISGVNVFAERSGVVMPGDAASEQDYRQAAQAFVGWVQKTSDAELQSIRKSLQDVKSHLDWGQTAQQWMRELQLVTPSISWEQLKTLSSQLTDAKQHTKAGAANQSSKAKPTAASRTLGSVQYINMAFSTEREQSIRTQLERSCPKRLIERFEAIDGKRHAFTEEEKKLFKDCDFLYSKFAARLMGNALSHLEIWKKTAQRKDHEAVLVVQDDALLIDDFMTHASCALEEMPADAPLLLLSDHEFAICDKFIPVDLRGQDLEARKLKMEDMITANIGRRDASWMAHCSLAYIITSQGAREIVEYTLAKGFRQASDHHIRNFLVARNMNYATARCLATSSSDVFKSEVWTNS